MLACCGGSKELSAQVVPEVGGNHWRGVQQAAIEYRLDAFQIQNELFDLKQIMALAGAKRLQRQNEPALLSPISTDESSQSRLGTPQLLVPIETVDSEVRLASFDAAVEAGSALEPLNTTPFRQDDDSVASDEGVTASIGNQQLFGLLLQSIPQILEQQERLSFGKRQENGITFALAFVRSFTRSV